MAVIEMTDAVVYPWAMVIHSKYTPVASPAVVSTRRFILLTHATESWFPSELLDFITIRVGIRFPITRDATRISRNTKSVVPQ
jgi:hypothetical protein